MILLYVTCKDKQEAEIISEHLLNKKLIACANYFPVNSMYWWNKKIIKDKECILIIKTLEKNKSIVEIEIKNLHSYGIPCILELNVESNEEYRKWVESEVNE